MPHFIYILKCRDKTLYTGYTNDLNKRILAHNSLKSGAKYTKGRRPVKLVYFEKHKTKSSALKKEINLKNMTRKQKLCVIKNKKMI